MFLQTRNCLYLRLIWWRNFLLQKNMLNAIGLYPDSAAGLSLFMDFLCTIQTFLFLQELIRKTACLWIACVYITSKLEILDYILPSGCQILPAIYIFINLDIIMAKDNFARKAVNGQFCLELLSSGNLWPLLAWKARRPDWKKELNRLEAGMPEIEQFLARDWSFPGWWDKKQPQPCLWD